MEVDVTSYKFIVYNFGVNTFLSLVAKKPFPCHINIIYITETTFTKVHFS